MKNREDAIVAVVQRLTDARVSLGLQKLKRSPTTPINKDHLPCIFIVEDVDEIIKHSTRGVLGYPCRRVLEIVLEIITDNSYDIKNLYRQVRSTVLANNPVVADDSFIRELRTEGPTGYGLPDVLGMKLVLALTYTDSGD